MDEIERDEIEFSGWRAWLTDRCFLIMLIGGLVTLVVWKLATPGYTQVTAALWIATSLAYAVWDGWALRWAVPILGAVAGFFVWAYFTDMTATALSLLRDRTNLHTLTLVGVIGWAVASSVIALALWWRPRDTEGR